MNHRIGIVRMAGARPTTTWVPGEQIEDQYGIQVPPTAPAGAYWLRVGLYRPEDFQRLELETACASK